jgi:hypothetical protein
MKETTGGAELLKNQQKNIMKILIIQKSLKI